MGDVPVAYRPLKLVYFVFPMYEYKRSCDNTPENFFFQILPYSPAYVRIIFEEIRGQSLPRSSLGKQSKRVQNKQVC